MKILAIVEVMFLMVFMYLYLREKEKDNRHECDDCPFRDICKEGKEDAE